MIEKEQAESFREKMPLPAEEPETGMVPTEEGEPGADAEKEAREVRFEQEFAKRYPQVDLRQLLSDENFLRFCGSRFGNEPLTELFVDYTGLLHAAEQQALARAESKSSRATGSGGSGGGEALTARQLQELEAWNKAYPQLKMTAKEFLSR